MHVDVNIAVEVAGQAQPLRARADIRERSLRRFLHHLAQFAGMAELAFAIHDADFSGKNGAADFGPGQTVDQPDFAFFAGHGVAEFDTPRNSFRLSALSATETLPSFTTLAATLPQTLPISRPRLPTPASPV